MKTSDRVLKTISILGVIMLIAQLAYPFILRVIVRMPVKEQLDIASIGIIGGADGPTAIYIASGNDVSRYCFFTLSAIIAIVPAVIIWHNKKKK